MVNLLEVQQRLYAVSMVWFNAALTRYDCGIHDKPETSVVEDASM
jgi:hypothetical protein